MNMEITEEETSKLTGTEELEDVSLSVSIAESPENSGGIFCKPADSDDIDKISRAVVTNLTLEQEKVKKLFIDVTESQRVILETLQQENAKFSECQILKEVVDTMEKAKVYLNKLTNIKKDMHALHEKSAELKRRAVRIQQEKQKEALMKEQQREREIERDLRLTARVAKPL